MEAIRIGDTVTGKPDYVWDTYSPTPVMPTYTFAWMVSKYKIAKSVTSRGVKVEALYIETSPVQRSADLAAKMLDHFEEKVFGIKYGLPKIDIVPVRAFDTGAMENMGMMTFRSAYVLQPEDPSNQQENAIRGGGSTTPVNDWVHFVNGVQGVHGVQRLINSIEVSGVYEFDAFQGASTGGPRDPNIQGEHWVQEVVGANTLGIFFF